ncbi:MAG TPA: cytochrome c oxidase assembly protein [Oceanipulchritudo sp.]|nr:cytochrome c oxidase assembly protein [Oceanipulchritudo sp.]
MIRWVHWHTEPALLIGILAAVWAYFVLIGPLREKLRPGEVFPRGSMAWFVAGVVSFYLAVGSPLDAMGENFLFSAHMVQHNVLMYVTAFLTVLAFPGWLVDAVLEKSIRMERVFRFLVHPLVAGFCFTFTFCVWHFPGLYEAALHNKVIHMVEHLTMFGASVQMLWPILSRSTRSPRMNWGMQILYIFLLMVAQIPLFGILTFSTEVLYPTYELAPRISFLDPMSDQVLGGLLMKVANMIISLSLMGRAFWMWGKEQAPERASGATVLA